MKIEDVKSILRGIIRRCRNPKCKDYSSYGGRGIDISQIFIDDPQLLINEVGDRPSPKHTIDRINNLLGYIPGNIRWVTPAQQQRNRRRQSNNKSGVTGVRFTSNAIGNTYVDVKWYEVVNGELKRKSKLFSVIKMGLLPAFAAGCKFREDKIKELNELGYGYSELHGK